MTAIETETGYRWRVTSFIRESPNHKMACALDIAPDIARDSMKHYAVFKQSDPVLYKRIPLIKDLQRVCHYENPYSDTRFGIFIEPDHLHLQVFDVYPGQTSDIRLFKWKQPKEIYPDTLDRMELPMTCTGYPLT